MSPVLLDCTFRDGGYYNAWDFPDFIVGRYLQAMKAAQVDVVELGFRFPSAAGFAGPNAYTTDDYLRGLDIPQELTVAVMVNGADVLIDPDFDAGLERLFPETAAQSPVDMVRFACHYHECERVLPAARWLAHRGYRVGFNLMQITKRTEAEVTSLARTVRDWPVEVLYFADSVGGMQPDDATRVIGWMRQEWEGPIGVHTHDNMGLALANTLRAAGDGAEWLDATVTGMGRGPGNARTEELAIEVADMRNSKANLVPLLGLIRDYFGPIKAKCGWGSNPFYYLSGKYGIHPTYVQQMLADPRYDEEDIINVIDHLREADGQKFSTTAMESARNFYCGEPRGSWSPAELMQDREVLILGTGPGVARHRKAIEAYIRRARPLVMALNTQTDVAADLIDLRVACNPVRLLADAEEHRELPQPLITPASMLPGHLREELDGKQLLDFGLSVKKDSFEFDRTHCITPNPMVMSYALAIANSGKAQRILMAGFDGYPAGDARNQEIESTLHLLAQNDGPERISVTPTRYSGLKARSIYGI